MENKVDWEHVEIQTVCFCCELFINLDDLVWNGRCPCWKETTKGIKVMGRHGGSHPWEPGCTEK